MNQAIDSQLLKREWFYPFRLPDGQITTTYNGGMLDQIHATRLTMMDAALTPLFGASLSGHSAVDLACHQGYFSTQLIERGVDSVIGIDARAEHIRDATAITTAMGLDNFSARQSDIHDVNVEDYRDPFDIVLCFGLIYHLENPVGALRVARELTSKVCLVETQVVPGVNGWVDWGNHRFVRPLKGSFGIIDEVDDTHGPEASTLGICLAPSIEGLLWVMQKIGFDRVELIAPPGDGYEQHVNFKRVMVAGYVD